MIKEKSHKIVLFFFCLLLFSKGVNAQEAKHIILIIGDGMQLENERAASRYLYGADFNLSFHSFPYKNYVSRHGT